MRTEHVEDWLSRLASAGPAPGGGAAAAMHAAMAAALVEKVCNFTIGRPGYAEHESLVRRVCQEASELRRQAVELADADARAFTSVTEAYKLPTNGEHERMARSAAIQGALVMAAAVPVRTAEVASRVLELVERIIGRSNTAVLSDLAVSASSSGAALASASVHVEVNRTSINSPEVAERLGDAVAKIEEAIENAHRISAEVRERISRAAPVAR
ncbi:cyclodeaminase/cyclohydrolase family protein [Crossiella sp. CA-258035]|uniref:cyclodeaminase/cyclohydrolase family protein n=1 Tax=Crossiella sp. CA-258035 TaxID=2981138 RepID=UPI0024BCFFD8|nr:cyclodeaminase/cyclohydrolase family protein [Crossiella sp. CA-258035]WHT19721.1 cyclodeaminase/cyclohydrolase family protein [Crossiella sp. CA-258035]